MAQTYFNDLKIVGLDEERTQKSLSNPSFRQLFLRLSGLPERYWIACFVKSRQQPRRMPWRKCWIENRHVIVDCIPEELAKHILIDLREDLAYANNEFRAFLGRELEAERKILLDEQDDVARIRDLKERLNFDE